MLNHLQLQKTNPIEISRTYMGTRRLQRGTLETQKIVAAGTGVLRVCHRLNAKRPACQSNQLTDASQNSLAVAELLRV